MVTFKPNLSVTYVFEVSKLNPRSQVLACIALWYEEVKKRTRQTLQKAKNLYLHVVASSSINISRLTIKVNTNKTILATITFDFTAVQRQKLRENNHEVVDIGGVFDDVFIRQKIVEITPDLVVKHTFVCPSQNMLLDVLSAINNWHVEISNRTEQLIDTL